MNEGVPTNKELHDAICQSPKEEIMQRYMYADVTSKGSVDVLDISV